MLDRRRMMRAWYHGSQHLKKQEIWYILVLSGHLVGGERRKWIAVLREFILHKQ